MCLPGHGVISGHRYVRAGLLVIAGVAVADSDHGYADAYTSTLEVTGALFALNSAVFIILALVGGSKTAPS